MTIFNNSSDIVFPNSYICAHQLSNNAVHTTSERQYIRDMRVFLFIGDLGPGHIMDKVDLMRRPAVSRFTCADNMPLSARVHVEIQAAAKKDPTERGQEVKKRPSLCVYLQSV